MGHMLQVVREPSSQLSSDAVDARDVSENPSSSVNGSTIPIVTAILITACILAYGAMSLSRVPQGMMPSQQLLRWGANFGPLTLGGQGWRLFTSVFVHLGLVHLAVNMWCLWDLGSFAERLYGRALFLCVYLASGVAGAMYSLVWHPFSLEAGASGAIFGIAGALIASFCFDAFPLPRRAMKVALLRIVAFAGYNLFLGVVGSGAGNAAHVGGLLAGLVAGSLLARMPKRWMAVTASALCLLLGYALLVKEQGYVVQAERGRTALVAGRTVNAIADLAESVRKNPKFTEGFFLLGQAYFQRQQYSEAEQAFRRALALDPQGSDVRYQLAVTLMAERRPKDALAAFEEIAKRDPANVSAQMGIGAAAELDGDYERALRAFQVAARVDPANPQVYASIGFAALQLEQPDLAISAFTKWADMQPDNPSALVNLAVAYKAKGMEKQSLEAYARALKLSPRK
jgi:rhomboid protease GluP